MTFGNTPGHAIIGDDRIELAGLPDGFDHLECLSDFGFSTLSGMAQPWVSE